MEALFFLVGQLLVLFFRLMWIEINEDNTMSQDSMSIVENGNAAIINSKNRNTIVFESGNAYRLYGRKNEHKVKHIGECPAPDFDQWDEYHFQKQYSYLGFVKIIKVKRTLKIKIN